MTPQAPDPRLSVVVALISGKRGDLERCLQALSSQRGAPDFEIVVPWDDAARDVVELAQNFPNVRFLHARGLDTRAARAGASREHHDTLRTIGLRAARGSIVALTEDHAVASTTWCADMVAALDSHPKAAAVGGAVECGATSLLGRAVYYCDFGRYQNPLPDGPAQYVSDSNVAYRRSALDAVADAWADDYHETVVHGALVACGFEIVLTRKSEVAQVRTGLSLGEALRERFVWGRSYAGTRVAGAPFTRRVLFAAMSALLPFVLTLRLLRGALARKRDVSRFLACLPLVFLLQVGWALGEFAGYATGDPGESVTVRDLAIVIPAYQAERFLSLSLPAAISAARGRPVLVVDAGSTDRTAVRAVELGARVVRLPERAGPAEARNAGVDAVEADVILFLDADCVAHKDVVERVLATFKAEPKLVGLTGSYDDDPPERNFASSYMNLRHSFTHHRARREGSAFWAGCGAVRREAFLQAGGFDARRYPRPMIEDIELGLRLAKIGKLRLDPRIQVKHLKRWTVSSVIDTDVQSRAIPWSELILDSGAMPDDLNLRRSQRIAAILAPFTLLSIALLPLGLALPSSALVATCSAFLVASLALNLDLATFFRRRRGFAFAVWAFFFHQVHLVYSSATFALVALRRKRRSGA